jgi:hypothetical protein
MSAISPFNSYTIDPEEVEEAEARQQDLRIMVLNLSAEARVAARSLGDNQAIERIAAAEKIAKADSHFGIMFLAKLAKVAECYGNTGLHKARPETLRERAAFLNEMADKIEGKSGPIPFVERRKA